MTPWIMTDMVLRGIERSTERFENGLAGWIDRAIDLLVEDGDVGGYYRIELGLPWAFPPSHWNAQ